MICCLWCTEHSGRTGNEAEGQCSFSNFLVVQAGFNPFRVRSPLTLLGYSTVIAAAIFSQLSLALCQQWAVVNARGNEALRNGGIRHEAKRTQEEWGASPREGISLMALQR